MAKIYKIILLLIFCLILPSGLEAANLSIAPSSATFEVGEIITLRVMVSSNSPLNAVSGNILFPTDMFGIDSVSKADSILNFWTAEPNFSKPSGMVSFEGVSLGGFSGATGNVVTIRVRAIKSGVGNISFQSGQVLANDGQGTDITGSKSGATFNIKEPQIKQPVPVVEEDVKTEPDIPQPSPSLKSPEIYLGYKYGEPAIIGTSDYAKQQVLLTFISDKGSKIFVNGMSDETGEFVVLVPDSLKHGPYTVTALVVSLDGRSSNSSNQIMIKVGNLFSDVGWSFLSLLIMLVIIATYQFYRISHTSEKHLSRKVKSGLEKTSSTVHKSFEIIREDIKDKKTDSLKKDINEAEEIIEDEIKKIESL